MDNLSFSEQIKFERAHKKVKSIERFYKHFIVYIIVNVLFLITAYYRSLNPQTHHHEFWSFQTFNTVIFWGVGLLCHAFVVFGTDVFLGRGWEERKMKEYLDKEEDVSTNAKKDGLWE